MSSLESAPIAWANPSGRTPDRDSGVSAGPRASSSRHGPRPDGILRDHKPCRLIDRRGIEKQKWRCAMATDLHVPESFAPPGLDSDALKFYEVVDGQILENPPMGAMESVLAGLLSELMAPFARAGRLGRVVPETLFLIDRTRTLKRRPDLAFVSDQR